MDEIFDLRALVSELTKDNREMLETIESLQSGLEASERENEQLRKIIRDMEEKEQAEPRPLFPPFSMQMELDEMIKKMGRDNFGFRGGKRP